MRAFANIANRSFVETGLDPARREEVYERYWSGTPVHVLLVEFKLPIPVEHFLSIFPPDAVEGACSRCGGALVREKRARAAAPQPAYCTVCRHSDDLVPRCRCAACVQARQEDMQQREARRAAAAEHTLALARARYWGEAVTPRPVTAWSLPALLWVGAEGLRERDTDGALPHSFRTAFYKAALDDGLRVPISHAPADFFDEAGRLQDAYLEFTEFHPSVMAALTDPAEHLHRVKTRLQQAPEKLEALWLDITAAECMEFAASRLQGGRYAAAMMSSELQLTIRDCLTRCSSRQVHYAVYVAVQKVLADLGSGRVLVAKHAHHTLLQGLRTAAIKVEQTPALGDKFWRPAFPRSLLSVYFFHHVLAADEDIGFTQSFKAWQQATSTPTEPLRVPDVECPTCHRSGAQLAIRATEVVLTCSLCATHLVYQATPVPA